MSFRTRLLAAFALLALFMAGLFTLLSDQLLRDGLEGEADERLALVASLFKRELPASLWPAPPSPGAAWREAVRAELKGFKESYQLERATLLFEESFSVDPANVGRDGAPELYWLGDGLKAPKVRGRVRVSTPLIRPESGWRKALYLKLEEERGLWLRVEAGTPFLGRVSTLQRRLFSLALALMLPCLALGAGLAFALSRRARSLAAQLDGNPQSVSLPGRDEFAALALRIDALIKSLAKERESRVAQARHLAFGVAHELRNPLAGLSLQTDLLKRRSGEGAPKEDLLAIAERVQAEADRMETTVARFLDFARTPVLNPESVDLGALALECSKGFRPAPAVDGQGTAQADRRSLALVLGVLLSNATEAAGEAGRVHVKVGLGKVTVWDSGPALPPEAREKLFSPFYTTKPRGLGLGLATAAVLADAMGGRLSLKSDAKTFELELPQ